LFNNLCRAESIVESLTFGAGLDIIAMGEGAGFFTTGVVTLGSVLTTGCTVETGTTTLGGEKYELYRLTKEVMGLKARAGVEYEKITITKNPEISNFLENILNGFLFLIFLLGCIYYIKFFLKKSIKFKNCVDNF
jgi:hypothetical protein